MLEKTYQPAAIEPRVNAEWEKADAFACGKPERLAAGAEPFCIVIPPPNVTGSLHMGHALNNTLQDILARFERMRGKDVLWQPGTDHAGIATQMVVERKLASENRTDRRTMGRDAFVKEVWAWKKESGDTIVNQLKRLGASCDWSRERFTMDEGLSAAVAKVFVELHRAGLIYKDKRLVNWDTKFQTAISDLEVVQVEKKGSFKWQDGETDKEGNAVAFDPAALAKVLAKDPSGHMYHFRYPLADDPKRFIVVATTRPETMLGDSGVAVHPDDERYKDIVGRKVRLPLVGREIPIVADEYSDPEKGTGAVKITPAHDFNDFEVGKRHGLAQINVLDAHGAILDGAAADASDVPAAYHKLDRFAARLRIVEDMAKAGLLAKIEPTTHTVPHGDRSNVAVEPWLTDQWYVNAAELAKKAIAAVEGGATQFVPKNWEKTYFEWMRNIEPWCISRQLWWGHQIPAWYGPALLPHPGVETSKGFIGSFLFVAHDERTAVREAEHAYNSTGLGNVGIRVEIAPSKEEADKWNERPLERRSNIMKIWRDPDVLDTWFSSALWPFSTLGWPDKTPELKRYYPTTVLVTGFDIIFFWVARMMMMGLYFMKEVPFRDVYIHALVRDEKGQKMSKSKGNVIDPLNLIDQYGADALRFTLAAMAAQGRDIKLATSRVEGYRNFATKLWNAARFAEMNECVRQRDFDPKGVRETVNRWIAGETQRAATAVTAAIKAYRFNEAAGAAYEFVWGIFCDWYLELIKPILNGDDERAIAETRATTAWVLDQILKLLHPFMPFITEELWAHMVEHGEKRLNILALAQWPEFDGLASATADDEIGWVVRLVSDVRSVRSEMNVPAGAKVPLVLVGADKTARHRVDVHGETLKRLARIDDITFAKAAPKGAAIIVAGETTAALPLAGVIDMDAERKRLQREIEKANVDIGKMDAKLSNPSFMERAKPEAIEEAQERKTELVGIVRRLEGALKRLET
ncbi:MAG: valine--tRNA ligase [Hyphomicrobiaceae bacterium]